jgi:hypothetical protein
MFVEYKYGRDRHRAAIQTVQAFAPMKKTAPLF